MKPLAIDLFCGLGGWTEGLLAEGYDVVGFDIERHVYGDLKYPAQLVLQDVLTLHGSQFKDAAVIVASPPCQEYSYMAMPWKRAKQIARALRGKGDFPEGYTGSRTIDELNALFNACFRIAKEADVPLIVENVRGAQPWVGPAKWSYGSFYLWGDVPALMPMTTRQIKGFGGTWFHNAELGTSNPNRNRTAVDPGVKVPGFRFDGSGRSFQTESVKVASESGRRTDVGNGVRFTSRDCGIESALKGPSGGWFNDNNKRKGTGDPTGYLSQSGSKSPARKAASAQIAKIPLPLARHIARVFKSAEVCA